MTEFHTQIRRLNLRHNHFIRCVLTGRMIESLEREFHFDLFFPALTAKLLDICFNLAPAARIVTDRDSYKN